MLVTHPGQADSDLPYMLIQNTPIRESDTVRPNVRCANIP